MRLTDSAMSWPTTLSSTAGGKYLQKEMQPQVRMALASSSTKDTTCSIYDRNLKACCSP